MLKHSLKSWFSTVHSNRQQRILLLTGVACLIAIGASGAIGMLVAIAGTGVISTAALTTLIINTLRILFVIYLLFSIVQILRASGKGEDRNT